MDGKLSLEDKYFMVASILTGSAMSLVLVGLVSKKLTEKGRIKVN